MNGCFQFAVAMVLAVPASGQSLIGADHVPAAQQLFDAAASASPLRCTVSPMRPALNFAFQFQVVYTIDVPLSQFQGSGHRLDTFLRVTPEGREPVYLGKSEGMPPVPETKSDGETIGTFVVGEGVYKADVLLEDDMHRLCRGSWQVQARPAGSERQLAFSTSPGSVEELGFTRPSPAAPKAGSSAARLTILLHAAPLSPNFSKLQPDDIHRMTDSISSLLRELPARSVRLIAFNLEQRTVVFRDDEFDSARTSGLADALTQLDLGVVDYKAMRTRPEPVDLLLGLIHGELEAPQPPEALILIGPRTRTQADIPVDPLGKHSATARPIFNLQFQASRQFQPMLPPMGRPSGRGGRRGPVTGDGPVLGPLAPNLVDIVERLTTRFKGQTIPIRNPHDLADAIQRMDARIPKTAPPAGAPGAKAVRPPAPPATSKAVEPPELAAAEDPVTLLMQLRDQVVEQGDRIPNHTCVETIRRDVFAPTAGQANQSCDTLLGAAGQRPGAQRLKPDSTDRLRLDVAFSTAGREIYSWAGAGKFEDGELDELVQEGAMGSGPFAAMLLSAFQNRATKYVFEGETTVDGRRLYEYSFAVSQPQSRYKVKAQKDWIVTGYTGGIVLDAQTAALVRLTTRTEELPPETHTCETRTSLEYELVQLKGNDYLLPKVARQRFIGRDGYEAENTMTFSACRDFRAESKLAFGDDPPTTAPAPTTPAIDLPRGLPVSVELMTSIRFDDFAAGDAIDGRLAVPVRDARGNTLLPAGTPVQGRLMRLETDYLEHAEHTVVLRWETIEIAGARVPFSLMTKRQPPKATEIGREGNMLRKRLTGFELPRPGETRYGIYTFPGAATKVDSGFRTEWFTLKP